MHGEQRSPLAFRIIVGRGNDAEDVNEATTRIAEAVGQLRAFALHRLADRFFETSLNTMPNESRARISVNPNVHFGKACVTGTRISVRDVLELLQVGRSLEAITTDYYPDLEKADVRACVEYAD